MQTYKIVDEHDNTIDDLAGLSLFEAENQLTRMINFGNDAYLTEDMA